MLVVENILPRAADGANRSVSVFVSFAKGCWWLTLEERGVWGRIVFFQNKETLQPALKFLLISHCRAPPFPKTPHVFLPCTFLRKTLILGLLKQKLKWLKISEFAQCWTFWFWCWNSLIKIQDPHLQICQCFCFSQSDPEHNGAIWSSGAGRFRVNCSQNATRGSRLSQKWFSVRFLGWQNDLLWYPLLCEFNQIHLWTTRVGYQVQENAMQTLWNCAERSSHVNQNKFPLFLIIHQPNTFDVLSFRTMFPLFNVSFGDSPTRYFCTQFLLLWRGHCSHLLDLSLDSTNPPPLVSDLPLTACFTRMNNTKLPNCTSVFLKNFQSWVTKKLFSVFLWGFSKKAHKCYLCFWATVPTQNSLIDSFAKQN